MRPTALITTIVVACASTAAPARADEPPPIHADSSYALSAFYTYGGVALPGRASPVRAAGLRLQERDGIVAGGVLTTLLGLFVLASNSSSKHVGTTYAYTSDATYQVDWYREKTAAERAADQRATEGVLGWMYYGRHQFDLEIYLPQKDISDARGFGVTFMWFSTGRRTVFEAGFPRLRALYLREQGTSERYRLIEYGAPLRVLIPAGDRVLFKLEMLLGGRFSSRYVAGADNETGTALVPVAADVTVGTDRLFLTAGGHTHLLGDGRFTLGVNAEIGARF